MATHAGIAARDLGPDVLAPHDGSISVRAFAAATFVEALTRDPDSVSTADVQRARVAGANDDALAEALYVAFAFNTINRIADALGAGLEQETSRQLPLGGTMESWVGSPDTRNG
jgi:alkylhydroperoxidase family enzyme